MKSILPLLGVAAVIGFAVWYQSFRWGECRMVGHSKLYCIMEVL